VGLALALASCGVCEPCTHRDGAARLDTPSAPPVDVGGSDVPEVRDDAGVAEGPLPIISDLGGHRLVHPRLVLVTYPEDENTEALVAHAEWMLSSRWLTTVGAEYGIGSGSLLAHVERTEPAPDVLGRADIRALVRGWIGDGSLPREADGTVDDVLYMLYVPAHTVVTDPDLGIGCRGFQGYHSESTIDGDAFAYAVVVACPDVSTTLTDLEAEERAAAHELFEGATNPLPTTRPSWVIPRSVVPMSPWLYTGPEIVDLCELRDAARTIIREDGFVASRLWSNAAARDADRDPCVPPSPGPYLSIDVDPSYVVSCPPGESTTFRVATWATAPVLAFRLLAVQTAGEFSVTISLEPSDVTVGEEALLTVTVPASVPSGGHALLHVQALGDGYLEMVPVVVTTP
jgi:hypothetical protein